MVARRVFVSFGYYDRDWVDPDPEPAYRGTCAGCLFFVPCPCGCGWGFCEEDVTPQFYEGRDGDCDAGCPKPCAKDEP